MKTLGEHEAEFWKDYEKNQIPEWEKCGIECPECKEELYVNNLLTFTSNPPMRQVRCFKVDCGYRGFIH